MKQVLVIRISSIFVLLSLSSLLFQCVIVVIIVVIVMVFSTLVVIMIKFVIIVMSKITYH